MRWRYLDARADSGQPGDQHRFLRCAVVDQRGYRAPTYSGLCDMGAFEQQVSTPTPVANAGPDETATVRGAVLRRCKLRPDNHTLLAYAWSQTGGAIVDFTTTLSRTSLSLLGLRHSRSRSVSDAFGQVSTPDEVAVSVGRRSPDYRRSIAALRRQACRRGSPPA